MNFWVKRAINYVNIYSEGSNRRIERIDAVYKYTLQFSPLVIIMVKSGRLRCLEHNTCMG